MFTAGTSHGLVGGPSGSLTPCNVWEFSPYSGLKPRPLVKDGAAPSTAPQPIVSYWCYCKTLGGLNHCNTVYHVLVSGIDGLSITSIIAELTAAAISYDLTNDASNITLRSFLVASGNSPAWLSPSGDFALGFHQIDGQKL
ncbi:hypothetical protein T459_25763 [Capsicum annuum]|uniref:Uncharacterized protein n=1 Tax=Capsicum annuum TaxID=4072 RepID=A0A2G2YLN6_CAPAN|nr:hypothetical protein T459_25763 [Capsicum annuum]